MRLVNLTCPNCGSRLKVDKETGECVCDSCGGSFFLDDEAQHVQYDNAEEAGYQFEKGRQKAMSESVPRVQYVNTQQQSTPKKTKLPLWVWVILWLVFFPFTAIYVVYKSKLPEKVKAVLIIAIALFCLYAAITNIATGGA